MEESKALILAAAPFAFGKDLTGRYSKGEGTDSVMLRATLPPKRQFLESLMDRDGQRFVELLLTEFHTLAYFVPVLDKILIKKA